MDKDLIELSTHSLNLWYGKKQVLREVNIAFEKNKISALIGPSGCGKSTLLRTFNRMHDLNPEVKIEGQVFLKNLNLYGKELAVTEIRRRIGMVFQQPNPFPKSIYENINYGLKINNIPEEERKGIIELALKESFLWEEVKNDLNMPATKLSGGQQQRLCIARAVALRPEVILLDEPCSALDPISTQKIEDLLRELQKNYTLVMVTHNMQQAHRLADQAVFMYLGEIIESGTSEEVFDRPKNELTRNYVQGHFG